ncbi:hypothetical protein WISP_111424 [Willisornis vidua]|uniref:Uncharacterized protein n=1 Tax=Willisornis vidua TaxID=1566151 RepID=A0ABQ9D1C3_9PASS|nr:hypothetical protein WISP_111424 [Willisornis vidua]
MGSGIFGKEKWKFWEGKWNFGEGKWNFWEGEKWNFPKKIGEEQREFLDVPGSKCGKSWNSVGKILDLEAEEGLNSRISRISWSWEDAQGTGAIDGFGIGEKTRNETPEKHQKFRIYGWKKPSGIPFPVAGKGFVIPGFPWIEDKVRIFLEFLDFSMFSQSRKGLSQGLELLEAGIGLFPSGKLGGKGKKIRIFGAFFPPDPMEFLEFPM